MLRAHYNWTRYWYLKGENIHVDGVGFPYDPGILNKNLVTFDSITHIPCLVLFGEPGIGKSTVLESAYQTVTRAAEAAGNASMFRDLGAYSTDAALVRDIFEDEKFSAWERGGHLLELFLDSLDECRLRVESIDSLLLTRIRRYDRGRLRLRIGCRSADWSVLLEKRLPELWKEGEVARYQLAPLGREHLRVAASEEGVDPDEFIRQVQQNYITGLAIKPVTLRMLLAIYRSHRTFPTHRTDIFLEGCTLLCDEINESRVASRRVGDLKAEERVAIAARIAAAGVFSNRGMISKKSGARKQQPDVVTFDEIRGGREPVGTESVEVTDAALAETLNTALFTPTDDGDTLRWSHQTYAEFLAAWYLKQHKAGTDRLSALLIHPSDPEQRIVPQLHEVAANTAHLVPGALELVLRHDPEVLVRSDMTAAVAEEREAAVDALLKSYAEERGHEPGHISINYASFAHAGLAGQLRPISDVELEDSFRGIDAGQILLVIDACNSGQALNAEEKRRGPMNSKGLAQLAYEKGMYVLTASQSIELAFESESLKHSYLTYALVEEGLKSRVKEADGNGDGEVWLREWFDYAEKRVPRLRDGRVVYPTKRQTKLLELIEVDGQGQVQTPRVFYRREPDAQPWVVANSR